MLDGLMLQKRCKSGPDEKRDEARRWPQSYSGAEKSVLGRAAAVSLEAISSFQSAVNPSQWYQAWGVSHIKSASITAKM